MKSLAVAPLVIGGACLASACATEDGGTDAIGGLSGAPSPHGYTTEQVRFQSQGDAVVGIMFVPSGTAGPPPCVVVLGPFGFVKEMSPMEYATRLAKSGFAVLIFDPRYSGESGGEPRRFESPSAKIVDVGAAIDYLMQRGDVNGDRVAALGICQGSSEMIVAGGRDPRIKAVALVSGQYLYRNNLENFFGGGGPTLEARIARGQAAKRKFDDTGAVDYTPVVDAQSKAAGLPWPPINAWYQPWTTPKWGETSRWENRYATMSDAEVWTFDVDSHVAGLKIPTLMIHGEQSDGLVEAARHVFDQIPAAEKHLHIEPGVFHTRFYDDPLVIEPAASRVAQWFERHVSTA